jgi:hypothetical protein
MQMTTPSGSRTWRTVIGALAVVGFITLFVVGIGLAIYGARLAPGLMSRINGAAVSLTSIFRSADEATLNVVGPSFFNVEDQEPTTASSTATSTGPAAPATGGTVPGPTYQEILIPIEPYGEADLIVRITDTGYLRSRDTDSFVSSNEVPDDRRGAVRFTVTNIGTNVSGRWDAEVKLPTSPSLTYDMPTQRSLNPGDAIDFVLGFDRPRSGDNRVITVSVDTGRDVRESNEDNNSDSARVDIER